MVKTYDSEQQRAIAACGGHFLVLAPPGCGKTDILSERIVRAREQGVDFADMLCLTFTNRASRSMLDRIREKVGAESCSIFVGNVHRYCSNFLFNNGLVAENTSIIDDDDQADILTGFDPGFFMNKWNQPDRRKVAETDNIAAYITQRRHEHPAKAIFLPPAQYEPYYQEALKAAFSPEQVSQRFPLVKYALLYQEYKQVHNAIGFSDILLLAYEALRHDSDRVFRRYRWIQVDEVQDLNALQMAIIDELLYTSGDFTVMYLGDEQQAIFSFLGAKMEQLNLLKERCHGHVLTLGTNYRSPSYLLNVFNTYAEKELGMDGALLPQPNQEVACGKFDLILTGNPSVEDEEQRVVKMLNYYLAFPGERVALLVPTNQAADRVSLQLEQAGISHFKISGTDLFKTKDYKTLSSLFCVAVNDFNHQAWERLVYGIGAVGSPSLARRMVTRLKGLMMTPSDLIADQTYVARFSTDYATREFVFFDTETTGLNVLDDDIVQIAAFKVDKGQKVPGSDFNIFLHTDKEIPGMLGTLVNPLREAYASHEHYSRAEGLRLFLEYVGDRMLLGHNVTFDHRILQANVARELGEQVSFEVYDSLHLIKCVEPHLRMYKLAFLLKELALEGKNSHLADEDVAATKALVDYCQERIQDILPQQQSFLSHHAMLPIIDRMKRLCPLFGMLQSRLFSPVSETGTGLAGALEHVGRAMKEQGIIGNLGPKFDIFLEYVRQEWEEDDRPQALFDLVCRHATDMSAGISEGDLVNSKDLVHERVFIMTVHKGKGLEFDNVIVLEANDGTYPFFKVNDVLSMPRQYSAEEVARAEKERLEDARKFYVALSRAKKRLCISYTQRNSYGVLTRLTPFMKSIRQYFAGG